MSIFEVTLKDASVGIQRALALVKAAQPKLNACEKDIVIVTALVNGIESELNFLLKEISTKTEVPALCSDEASPR